MKTWLRQNKKLMLWVLRIAIPTVILSIHWAMGIPLVDSVSLLFLYLVVPLLFVFLCFVSIDFFPVGIFLLPLVISFLKLYGLREPEMGLKPKNELIFRPEKDLSHLVGMEGKTITPMRPAGKVIVNETVYNAISEGIHIENDREVTIIAHKGYELQVRLV